ncbi:hypothetical protein V6N11_048809 [Hibiscus sabdariffa]|uniref:Uncharacterized protein n=1 Tax=Hibiscus sabdariffa TaxID=183260 RepID=A0ABR2PWC6_9ROSI
MDSGCWSSMKAQVVLAVVPDGKPTVGTEETLLQNDANMPSSRTRPTGNRWTPTPILSPPSSYPPMGRLSMREKLVPRGYSGEYLRYEG